MMYETARHLHYSYKRVHQHRIEPPPGQALSQPAPPPYLSLAGRQCSGVEVTLHNSTLLNVRFTLTEAQVGASCSPTSPGAQVR